MTNTSDERFREAMRSEANPLEVLMLTADVVGEFEVTAVHVDARPDAFYPNDVELRSTSSVLNELSLERFVLAQGGQHSLAIKGLKPGARLFLAATVRTDGLLVVHPRDVVLKTAAGLAVNGDGAPVVGVDATLEVDWASAEVVADRLDFASVSAKLAALYHSIEGQRRPRRSEDVTRAAGGRR